MVSRPVKILVAMAVVLLAVSEPPAAAQSGSVSATMTLSVRVLRPCALTTPSQVPDTASPAPLEIRCDRQVSSSTVGTGLVPVKGTSAPTAVNTVRTAGQVTLSVDF